MLIKSGVPYLSKTEIKSLQLVISHINQDLSYGGGGTFSKGDSDNSFDEKEAKKVSEGIELLKIFIREFQK